MLGNESQARFESNGNEMISLHSMHMAEIYVHIHRCQKLPDFPELDLALLVGDSQHRVYIAPDNLAAAERYAGDASQWRRARGPVLEDCAAGQMD